MQRPKNLKVGDQFRVIKGTGRFKLGETITLIEDDGTDCPFFWNADKSDYQYIYFSQLEPYIKTIRDPQVGDIVVDEIGNEHMVLERGQNTVMLSFGNDFKKSKNNYTFDELEKDFTLKAEPEVVDDKTAEAIKVLEEAGYKISKE